MDDDSWRVSGVQYSREENIKDEDLFDPY